VGDFSWNMRAGLVANTVHVPETWGGWRVHSGQSTTGAKIGSPEHRRKISDMIDHAIAGAEPFLPPQVRRELKSRWVRYAQDMREFGPCLDAMRNDALGRRAFLLRRLLAGSWAVREHIKTRLTTGPRWPESAPPIVQDWLGKAGVTNLIVPV
jgi:hypothetical protein